MNNFFIVIVILLIVMFDGAKVDVFFEIETDL